MWGSHGSCAQRWSASRTRAALIRKRIENDPAALGAVVPLCWIVIQLYGSFPGDSEAISRIRHPHPGEPLGLLAHIFALLGNPIVAALSVASPDWPPIDS